MPNLSCGEAFPRTDECSLKLSFQEVVFFSKLPTGFGKSLVFQMAPLVHAKLSKLNHGLTANPIIIVISPLVSLMEDQTPVVRRVDSAIHWINHYPLDNSVGFTSVYPLDCDLSGG